VTADFEAVVKQVLDNIGIILKAAGMTYKDVAARAGVPDRHGSLRQDERGVQRHGRESNPASRPKWPISLKLG